MKLITKMIVSTIMLVIVSGIPSSFADSSDAIYQKKLENQQKLEAVNPDRFITYDKQVDKMNNIFDYFQKYMRYWTDYYG